VRHSAINSSPEMGYPEDVDDIEDDCDGMGVSRVRWPKDIAGGNSCIRETYRVAKGGAFISYHF